MSWLPDVLYWFYNFITNPAVSLFLGAFLGGLCGYGASWWYQRQETQARRKALFQVLKDEMRAISAHDQSPIDGSFWLRDPIHISAVSQLLSGQTLDARKDAPLIRKLVAWQGFEASLNELGRITNQAAMSVPFTDERWQALHKVFARQYQLVNHNREVVLRAIPSEYQDPH
jgi:hypothetical protein